MRIFFVVLCCLASFALNAQTQYSRGYIILPGGTRVEGEVRSASNVRASFGFEFKSENTPGEAILGPGDVLEYGVYNGPVYVSKTINIAGNDISAFLEVRVDGKVRVLNFLNRFFILKGNDMIEIIDTSYSGVLQSVLADSPAAIRYLKTHNNIEADWYRTAEAAVSMYNGAAPMSNIWPRFSATFSVGVHLLSINFADPSPIERIDDYKFYSDSKVNFGVETEFSSRKYIKNLSFVLGAKFLPTSTKFSRVSTQNFDSVSFDAKHIIVPIGLKFNIGDCDKLSGHIAMKVAPSVVLSQSSIWLHEEVVNGDLTPSTYKYEEKSPTYIMPSVGATWAFGRTAIVAEVTYVYASTDVKWSVENTNGTKHIGGLLATIGLKLK